jgi:hypothetical protein
MAEEQPSLMQSEEMKTVQERLQQAKHNVIFSRLQLKRHEAELQKSRDDLMNLLKKHI